MTTFKYFGYHISIQEGDELRGTQECGATNCHAWWESICNIYPSYESTIMQRFESFENPMVGSGNQSFGSHDLEEEEDRAKNPQFDKALYDFTAGGDDELNLTAEEEVEIEYEGDGWFYVRKKRPRRDGKMVGLIPVLYVSSS